MTNVKRDELRWMLKRIAMGLAVSPLALIAGCTGCGSCSESSYTTRQEVTQAQLDSVPDGDCLPLCLDGSRSACRVLVHPMRRSPLAIQQCLPWMPG